MKLTFIKSLETSLTFEGSWNLNIEHWSTTSSLISNSLISTTLRLIGQINKTTCIKEWTPNVAKCTMHMQKGSMGEWKLKWFTFGITMASFARCIVVKYGPYFQMFFQNIFFFWFFQFFGLMNMFLKSLVELSFTWTLWIFLLRFPSCIHHSGWHQHLTFI